MYLYYITLFAVCPKNRKYIVLKFWRSTLYGKKTLKGF
ncbi:hypothetical protein 7t3_0444 [Salmonella phage 7t3]|nr:hypothetical protein 7t3_0444 [Salmonella phage 7t3]